MSQHPPAAGRINLPEKEVPDRRRLPNNFPKYSLSILGFYLPQNLAILAQGDLLISPMQEVEKAHQEPNYLMIIRSAISKIPVGDPSAIDDKRSHTHLEGHPILDAVKTSHRSKPPISFATCVDFLEGRRHDSSASLRVLDPRYKISG
jgi:hypothetical protein